MSLGRPVRVLTRWSLSSYVDSSCVPLGGPTRVSTRWSLLSYVDFSGVPLGGPTGVSTRWSLSSYVDSSEVPLGGPFGVSTRTSLSSSVDPSVTRRTFFVVDPGWSSLSAPGPSCPLYRGDTGFPEWTGIPSRGSLQLKVGLPYPRPLGGEHRPEDPRPPDRVRGQGVCDDALGGTRVC